MKILFTGFTSRTVGSDRNTYDYMSNVFVLRRALELAGHEVTCRPVSLMDDPCIEEDFDVAVVGVAACQGFSSRFKLGALWALHKFGKRAAIFPSDGKNVGIFPNSVRTCLTGSHGERTPFEYFLYGQLKKESSNVDGKEIADQDGVREIFIETLRRLPHVEGKPACDWPILMPLHSWGNPRVYERVFGNTVTMWDPTHIAVSMQFAPAELAGPGGRFTWLPGNANIRERAWVVSTLQDQSAWLKKMKPTWPVKIVGNKRQAKKGEATEYVPELEMIRTFYRDNWGHLAFGYPLGDGGWWRMRYVHAALAGIVTACDEQDQMKMPDSYRWTRSQIERMSDDRLSSLAQEQHFQLMDTAWPAERSIEAVDAFVKGLA